MVAAGFRKDKRGAAKTGGKYRSGNENSRRCCSGDTNDFGGRRRRGRGPATGGVIYSPFMGGRLSRPTEFPPRRRGSAARHGRVAHRDDEPVRAHRALALVAVAAFVIYGLALGLWR